MTPSDSHYEVIKATVQAKMLSGRYRTEKLCRYWSQNRSGFCLAPTCQEVPEDLDHILILCPTLSETRTNLHHMWTVKTEPNPALQTFVTSITSSTTSTQVQFILDPCVFPEVIQLGQIFGQAIILHILYLTRTYAYYMHRQRLIFKDAFSRLS